MKLQEHAATQFVNFGENLDSVIASAYGGKHDIRGTMIKLAMPFVTQQQKSHRGSSRRGRQKEENEKNGENLGDEISDDEESTMSSNDLEELVKIFEQLQEVEENLNDSKGKKSKFQRKRRAAEAVFTGWGQTAVRKFSDHLPQRFQQNFNRQQSIQRKTIERAKSIKLRALEIIMKLRSKQGMKVRKETRATKLVSIVLGLCKKFNKFILFSKIKFKITLTHFVGIFFRRIRIRLLLFYYSANPDDSINLINQVNQMHKKRRESIKRRKKKLLISINFRLLSKFWPL